MSDDIKDNIKKFRNFVTCWSSCYKVAIFSYVALKQNNETPTIICSNINLFSILDISQLDFFVHETQSIIAGFTLCRLENNPLCFLSTIDDGIVSHPDGKKLRLFDTDNDIVSNFDSGVGLVNTNNTRIVRLSLLGNEIEPVLQKLGGIDELECELRSHEVPFDGILDLLHGAGFRHNQTPQKSELLITADTVLTVDRAQSVISRGLARIFCLKAPDLNSEQLRIGIRPLSGKYTERKSINGSDLEWKIDSKGISRGYIEINTKGADSILVFLSHSNTLFDRWWVFDPEKHINPLYVIHQTIDKDLLQLRSFLSGQSKHPADDFENGVFLLLTLLRFSVMHYGLIPTLQDWPDLLAFTPANHLLIIDCTTRIPNENNKVSKLLTRTEQIRAALQGSGNSYIEILPVVITAISRNGIENDIKEAAQRGVVVATKENIENLFQYIQLQLPPTPIEIFAEAKSLLNQATLPSN
jgi:hypothetical protein